MLARLEQALAALPELLAREEGWRSLDIDYHPPHVERLFTRYGDDRICLHRLHPCPAGASLLHPHPWPCAVAVLAGRYEMGVGYGPGLAPPRLAAKIAASAPLQYEMLEPDAWHFVRAVGDPVLSVMVTGTPWKRPTRAPRALLPLAPTSAVSLRRAFLSLLETHHTIR